MNRFRDIYVNRRSTKHIKYSSIIIQDMKWKKRVDTVKSHKIIQYKYNNDIA